MSFLAWRLDCAEKERSLQFEYQSAELSEEGRSWTVACKVQQHQNVGDCGENHADYSHIFWSRPVLNTYWKYICV